MSASKSPPPAWRYMLSDVLFDQTEEDAVVAVIRSKWLSQGPRTSEFEKRFAEFIGSRFALAVSNCTAGLHLAMLAAGIGPGDEVIVPSLSFVATANAVLYVGATPVFADIESLDRPLLSIADVERRITPKTRAVVPMHYGGYPCAMGPLLKLAREHKFRVIEDDAHAVGSHHDGRLCGTLGDIGCFSFFGNKNLPAGEGGMVTTQDEALYEDMKLRRSHGMTSMSWDRFKGHSFSYDVVAIGYNFRMPELTAAVGMAQLGKLAKHNLKRDEVFNAYLKYLSSEPKLTLAFAGEPTPGARHLMPIVLAEGVDRHAFMQALRNAGIQTSIHYPPIHKFTNYANLANGEPVSLPKTDAFTDRVVTLPFHPGLEESDVQVIASEIVAALKSL